jgi:staphylopine/pseudopaline/yersinopine synthase
MHGNRVLIAGTGPASIQMAVLLKRYMDGVVGIAGRASVRSEPFFAALIGNGLQARVDIQNEQHRQMEGECMIDHVYHGYAAVSGTWDTVILAVTTDAYIEVIQQIDEACLRQVSCVILLSPTIGSNSLVRQYMNALHIDAEIISFSTYLGDTRWMHERPSNRVITTGVKRKLFIGSSHAASSAVADLCMVYERLGIAMEVMRDPIEAETRNISLYVHPPLFMNDYSLSAVFGEATAKTFVYKMYPEGPITQYVIRDMLAQWREITSMVEKLDLRGVNLLAFMTDDNYPVRPESLSRRDIEGFLQFETIHQEYLLFIRYASLLVDPFSEPDRDGRYYDFSAVPIRQIYVNRERQWDIPRMPKEDYYRIKIMQGIARHVDSSCPTIDRFIARYERKLEETAEKLQGERLSEAFAVRSFEEDLKRICSDIGTRFGNVQE